MNDEEKRYAYVAFDDSGEVIRYRVTKENRKTLTVVINRKGSRAKVAKTGAQYAFATRDEAEAHVRRNIAARIGRLEREIAGLRARQAMPVPFRDLAGELEAES